MSKKEKVVLQCGNCDKTFSTEIWTEINLEDQELDHKLFSDQINIFECDNCEKSGFVCYPIKITDKEAGEQAIAIPLNRVLPVDDPEDEDYIEISPAFFVLEIKKKKPLKVSYDLNELKFEINKWRGEPFTPYTGPPEEKDIEEGLAKGFINEKEAEKLRAADWESIEEKMYREGFMEKKPVDFDHEQDEVLDFYFRLNLELDRLRKIIKLRRDKQPEV
jgi:hypothetical protein